MDYTDQDILEQTIDNSLVDRVDGNLPESDVDPTQDSPDHDTQVLPGANPEETDPTVASPEMEIVSPSDMEGGE